MATEINTYQCPACTGPLRYDGGTGKLQCDYCDSSFEVAYIEELNAPKEAQAEEVFEQTQWDDSDMQQWGTDEGMRAYTCPSCGAQLICDETTAATACPYCGNPTVVPGQFSGGLKPDYVIPFKLSKEAARENLAKLYKGKKFLPSTFAANNRIEEIKGIYVPFWLFDGMADASVQFEASNTRVYRSGDYEVTATDHYRVHRAGTVEFAKIPVDASTKMPDDHMDAIEPFDYSELKPFSNAYLPGYLADKYDVTAQDSAARADERAVNTAEGVMRDDVHGYGTCITVGKNVRLQRGKVHYGLLPVYLLNTKWNGKNYLFAMNGQTGKLIGDLPVDKGKYWAWFAGLTAGMTALIGTLLMWLFF